MCFGSRKPSRMRAIVCRCLSCFRTGLTRPSARSSRQVYPFNHLAFQALVGGVKLTSLLFRSRIDFSFLRLFYAKSLIRCIRSKNVDIIHTHLFTTDIIGAVAAQATGVRAVTTIHGDYMMYDAHEHFRTMSNIKYFGAKFRMILQTYSAVAVISDEQLQFFSRKMGELKTATPLFKIYNGFSATEPNPMITREELGVPDDALVFGMAAGASARRDGRS